jgi:hypothetical protein
MSKLFENAVASITVGIEDYRQNSRPRSLSAVRNFYAGTLLLAKEVLVRKVPGADAAQLLGAKYKPVSDGADGVEYEVVGNATIDFTQVAERFRDFGITISHAQLKDLNRIRNDVEHLYTGATLEAVREAIAKAFPVVVELFRLADEDPREVLGEAWQTMLEVRTFYESERAQCEMTFDIVDWKSDSLAEAPKLCPACGSHLVEQIDSSNTDYESADAKCRACGAEIEAEELVETAIDEYLALSNREIKHGAEPVHTNCHECSLKTYVLAENQCVRCHATLGTCAICSKQLTPDNKDPDGDSLCSYHAYVLSKDD